jgi:HEPN domain-containing protein
LNQNFDLAKAYLIEANNDFNVVSLLTENNKFSIVVFHAQQAVEKLQKACLTAEGEIGI